jgi:hypothetical protein
MPYICYMNELLNKIINIEVYEPVDWKQGCLSGVIREATDKEIIVKMGRKVKGKRSRSADLRIGIRYEDDSFEHLKKKSLTVNCGLIDKNNVTDFLAIGTASLI